MFHSDLAATHDVIDTGEKALVLVYYGMLTDTLDSLQHKRLCVKVASTTSHVKPQSLPPTSAAAKYHSLCVYLQVQEWKGSAAEIHLMDWGWQECKEGFVPIQHRYLLLLNIYYG